MTFEKVMVVKLFFNTENNTHYVEMGGFLFPVRPTVAVTMQEKFQIEIRRASGIKEIQKMFVNGQ